MTMDGDEIGSFEACDRIVQLVLAKDVYVFSLFISLFSLLFKLFTFRICEVKPCLFNGVYQPSLLDSFPNGKVLLLSYFYDRLSPFFPPGTPITVSTFASTAQDICKGHGTWLTNKHWSK